MLGHFISIRDFSTRRHPWSSLEPSHQGHQGMAAHSGTMKHAKLQSHATKEKCVMSLRVHGRTDTWSSSSTPNCHGGAPGSSPSSCASHLASYQGALSDSGERLQCPQAARRKSRLLRVRSGPGPAAVSTWGAD